MQNIFLFFYFWENLTFGYYFSPCVVRLTTGWNELDPNGYTYFCNVFVGYKLKGNGVSLGK
jgi:hypothetical protein